MKISQVIRILAILVDGFLIGAVMGLNGIYATRVSFWVINACSAALIFLSAGLRS
ncbi:hypothetical protein [Trinickia dinghuensis]|uniref:hypothetical protein n=1 Tax=Trinickia dinghuensis TaxID=2291023 RepID=UPI0015F1A0C2|nr:hypothetical protein [Trinickia dinghuensis]